MTRQFTPLVYTKSLHNNTRPSQEHLPACFAAAPCVPTLPARPVTPMLEEKADAYK
jgi:hypothetical protein